MKGERRLALAALAATAIAAGALTTACHDPFIPIEITPDFESYTFHHAQPSVFSGSSWYWRDTIGIYGVDSDSVHFWTLARNASFNQVGAVPRYGVFWLVDSRNGKDSEPYYFHWCEPTEGSFTADLNHVVHYEDGEPPLTDQHVYTDGLCPGNFSSNPTAFIPE